MNLASPKLTIDHARAAMTRTAALAMPDPTERKLIRLWCPSAARLP